MGLSSIRKIKDKLFNEEIEMVQREYANNVTSITGSCKNPTI